jgi:hypothetical protein
LIAAAGALRSTPRDLSRFAAAILASSGARIPQDDQRLLAIRRASSSLGGVQALGWEVLDASRIVYLQAAGHRRQEGVERPVGHLNIIRPHPASHQHGIRMHRLAMTL